MTTVDYSLTVSFEYTVHESTNQCILSAGNFPLTPALDPTLLPGQHNLTVVYTDTFGQIAEEMFTFVIDGKCLLLMRL